MLDHSAHEKYRRKQTNTHTHVNMLLCKDAQKLFSNFSLFLERQRRARGTPTKGRPVVDCMPARKSWFVWKALLSVNRRLNRCQVLSSLEWRYLPPNKKRWTAFQPYVGVWHNPHGLDTYLLSTPYQYLPVMGHLPGITRWLLSYAITSNACFHIPGMFTVAC